MISAVAPRRPIRLAALRVPLAVKIIGANLLVIAAFLVAWVLDGQPLSEFLGGALILVVAVHLVLVLVALRPIRDLEIVASRIWNGDFGARVEWSSVADDDVLRVGAMFNTLLDGLESDRTRMRALATDVIAAGDRDRAALARELHESTAQNVASLLLKLAAAARDTPDPELAKRLQDARDSAEEILAEVQLLSHTVHPAVLDDLGLEAALRRLARDASHGNGIDIDVKAAQQGRRLPRNVEAVLYRVAQEAVGNATAHASPRRIRITLDIETAAATIDVHDDGVGFDLSDLGRRRSGVGLRSMRERVALADGWLDIKTASGSGTTVSATVPLESQAIAAHGETA